VIDQHTIIQPLRPKGDGWHEFPIDRKYTLGYDAFLFVHENGLKVISAVEVAEDGGGFNKGPEYHLSVSVQTPLGPVRCTGEAARWVLGEFGLEGAEEDNHVPNGKARHFWRAVNESLIGLECPCKEDEPVIREDKGDYVWRPAPTA
jgi:hypothetical protein